MFKSLTLTPRQEATVASVHSKCVSTCKMLTPEDLEASEKCAEECSEKNRDLYRMANASNYGVIIAMGILAIAIWIALTHKK